jgi:hypothetical protein
MFLVLIIQKNETTEQRQRRVFDIPATVPTENIQLYIGKEMARKSLEKINLKF